MAVSRPALAIRARNVALPDKLTAVHDSVKRGGALLASLESAGAESKRKTSEGSEKVRRALAARLRV
jgi:hypothetical protein